LGDADYYFTNFWGDSHTCEFPDTVYSIKVLNSSILSIYKVEKDTASQRQYRNAEIFKLERFIAANDDDYYLHYVIGSLFFRNSQYDSAENHIKWALKLKPGNIEAINNLSMIYGAKGKYADVVALNKIIIQQYPDNVVPYTTTGLAYMFSAKYDSAIYYLQEAVSVNPDYNASFEILAITYKKINKQDSARKYETIAQLRNPAFRAD